MGCDSICRKRRLDLHLFQSTHPHGVRQDRVSVMPEQDHISIHAPAWGATSRFWRLQARLEYFNPRTRMGCDYIEARNAILNFAFQSTHPHGVRHYRRTAFPRAKRFQSTHPHGVRPTSDPVEALSDYFNPRTRMGCDDGSLITVWKTSEFQSTHPHGVRLLQGVCACPARHFNPRTRMGCDRKNFGITNSKRRISIHAPAWGATVTISPPP